MYHLNYITLWRIAEELNQKLFQAVWMESFSQQKDELIIGFSAQNKEDLYLRISCQSKFPYFVPVAEYHRAGKNTIDLFEECIGSTVQSVKILPGDRIIGIELKQENQENQWLICKMHGARSNILHVEQNQIISSFRKKLDQHWIFDATKFNENPWNWLENNEKWTFWDKNMLEVYGSPNIQVLEKLFKSPIYISDEPVEFLFGTHPDYQSFETTSTALAFYLKQKSREFALSTLFEEIETKIALELKQRKGKIQSWWKSLEHITQSRSLEEIGHLILANIQQIPHYCHEIEVEDWYTGGKTKIKLDPKLNAQENAQVYYKKQKVRVKEEKFLLKRVEEAEKALEKWEQWSLEIKEIKSVKVLEKWVKNHPELRPATRLKEKNEIPFRKFEKNGYQIWVGRDSKNNDELTVQYAKKDDIWLHAKDVAGSHVVIRIPDSKPLAIEVLQYAAGLAAWYSKVRNQNWVPVIYTPKKYVRKGKGFGPGKVTVEREEVIFVQPIKPGREDD